MSKRSDISTIEVLKACIERKQTKEFITDMLMQKFNVPEKVVYAALNRDNDNGYIDFGVSLRTAWATEKGLQLLRDNKILIME